MRLLLLCMMAGVALSPLDCGEQPAKRRAEKSEKRATAEGRTPTGPLAADAESHPADPLVPPIDLGEDLAPVHGGGLSDADFRQFDFTSGDRAELHAHGEKVCASGCAVSRHPTAKLTKAKYLWLLRRFAEQPLDETSPALESLMYYGRQSLLWMEKLGTGPLDEPRVALLKRELPRDHVLISFRIVDEHGVRRVFMPPTRVPLDLRHEFRMETKDLPPLITSGTVKRVGLHHLWTRL